MARKGNVAAMEQMPSQPEPEDSQAPLRARGQEEQEAMEASELQDSREPQGKGSTSPPPLCQVPEAAPELVAGGVTTARRVSQGRTA
jgi:hypothetical protein